MVDKKKIKSRSFLRKLLKVLLYSFIAWVLILIIATAMLYIFKDDISKKLLLSLNDIQNGEITLEDISFSLSAQFPSISLRLNNTDYYEHPIYKMDTTEIPLREFHEIYAAINILDLIGGRINVSKITIDGGTLNFVTYKDCIVNLFNVLSLEKPAHLTENKDLIPTHTFNTDELKSSEENKNTSIKIRLLT